MRPAAFGVFSTVLRRDGYRVLEARNGVEALELANDPSHEDIHILLSDVAMPYMRGIQLAEQLRETRPNIQILLTSGLPNQEVIERCEPYFSPDFLAKPFSVSDLSWKIKQLAAAI
ncbi:MAG: response regulator [SAR202 cluster bacterium]|nr:response regulator [SAR202 cluster bacterium]